LCALPNGENCSILSRVIDSTWYFSGFQRSLFREKQPREDEKCARLFDFKNTCCRGRRPFVYAEISGGERFGV
jgi:hypothetical protein